MAGDSGGSEVISRQHTQDDLEPPYLGGGVEGIIQMEPLHLLSLFQISQQSGLKQEAKRADESSQRTC